MFEEMMEQINTKIRSSILDNLTDVISLEGKFPLLLNRKQVAELIGISVNSFDDHYRYKPDFPKEDSLKRWKKSEVIAYFKETA